MDNANVIALDIDLDALAANHAVVRRAAGAAEVAPVVKADAYGLGLVEVGRRLHAEGARSFFVARIAEGEALRRALGDREAKIFVLDGCPPVEVGRFHQSALTPVLNTLEQLQAWTAQAAAGPVRDAALHIDTGLNRLGLSLPEAAAASETLGAPKRIGLVISHLACAGEPDHPMNREQAARFAAAAALFPDARRSLANSAGVWLGRDFAFEMVRPGIALYGGGPRGTADSSLAAVATLSAPILQIRDVAAAQSVGYGAAFATSRPTRVAIVAAGYADGVLRASSPRGYGMCNGRRLPFIGRVSMDLIAMDATDTASARVGDRVEFIGAQVALDDAAAAAGTVAYEVLVRLGARIDRRYAGRAA